MELSNVWDRFSAWVKQSVLLRIAVLGVIVGLLLIPASMIRDLVREREGLRSQAEDEVSSKWGGPQVLGGPVLALPYLQEVKNSEGKVSVEKRTAYFLPDELAIGGTVAPEKRYRGIYVVALYNTQLTFQGRFPSPDLVALGIPRGAFLVDEAYLAFGISDMKGIRDRLALKIDGRGAEFRPGIPTDDLFASGVSVPVAFSWTKGVDFDFKVNLNGARELGFLPFGKETRVSLSSPWAHPGFEGDFLPAERTVDGKGFTAQWRVFHLNRNYPQQWTGEAQKARFQAAGRSLKSMKYSYGDDAEAVASKKAAGAFGVRFLLPVDEYKKTERASKYAAMLILLTFLAYFFVEVIQKTRVHPIQYFLVGAALCLFYLLLLSISEHLSFAWAYLIGSAAILSLIGLYTRAIFSSARVSLLITGILALLYVFFYSLLQLQDYSLLMGSLGLLGILAAIMMLTRRVDWYRLGADGAGKG